ncbi:uridine kinase [Streptomyces pseudovenezuelae]|uniref:uridine kinase family protein n=1 Tax=Streptomyces pseudovenezuelae TaxID=67350 RepID=UPI002E36CBF2|nr:uridine kinase [Streptomyces pseudovenezuelae]WUA88898.1 uridine kinase [Streptomyces pseudovenezuelae]
MTRASKPTRGVDERQVNASHWCPVSSQPPIPTRVVLLCGPSGSGKSLLSARSGLPVLRLDDFYKEGDDPTLPLVAGSSDIDWDHPLSWDADTAVAAIVDLCRTGRTKIPVYDISLSARTGEESVEMDRPPLFIAEGIFAAEIVTRCRELGVLADALCLSRGPVRTFRRRFLRDLREGRKSVPFLLRRGWRLMRRERSIIARQTALGAHRCDKDEALGRLAAAAAGRRPAATPAA